MPRPCTVCQHAAREAIERALAQGQTFRNISKRFGTSPSALHRHRRDHERPGDLPQGGGGRKRHTLMLAPLPPGPDLPPEPGTLREVSRRLWWGVLQCEDLLGTSTDASLRLKSVYALAQVSLAFAKLVELSDLDARLTAIEALMNRRNGHGKSPP